MIWWWWCSKQQDIHVKRDESSYKLLKQIKCNLKCLLVVCSSKFRFIDSRAGFCAYAATTCNPAKFTSVTDWCTLIPLAYWLTRRYTDDCLDDYRHRPGFKSRVWTDDISLDLRREERDRVSHWRCWCTTCMAHYLFHSDRLSSLPYYY